MAEVEHPRLAVMFTDIKGYSRMMSEDESAALGMLSEHNSIMESVIEAHGGRIVKQLGDSYMVVFDHGETAVKCALHALTKITAHNRKSDRAGSAGTLKIEIRVGIHEGSMLERDGDYFGENVNIAARLEQMAQPMTIASSEQVLQEVATRIKCEARFLGAQALKNLRYPVSVYQLTPSDTWKLYLSADEQVTDHLHGDILGDITNADSAWQHIEEFLGDGDLENAQQLADASLSRFGGTYIDYTRLAAIHLLARATSDAQSAMKMGEMLGQKGPEDQQVAWVQTLANASAESWSEGSTELGECISSAQAYLADHANELAMILLVESAKAKITGHLGGLTRLAQQHPDKALILRGYAESLKDQGRADDALRMLGQAITVAPHVADHQLRRVQWMVDDEDLDAVLGESEELAKKFPDNARVYEWTGKTRLLNLDPHGGQWIFQQHKGSASSGGADSAHWQACSLIQQGRFEQAFEISRREMRSAIRQRRSAPARSFLELATTGMYLGHWPNAMETLEEYRRYDPQWAFPQASLVAAQFQRDLLPWDRALTQLLELGESAGSTGLPHSSGLAALSLLTVAGDVQHWTTLHDLEFFRTYRDWIVETSRVEAAALEARAALRFDKVDTWHLQLVPVLTSLSTRLDHRLPSLWALAGLIQVRLNNYEGGKNYLQHARKLWQAADWPVWEIQQADSALIAGSTTKT